MGPRCWGGTCNLGRREQWVWWQSRIGGSGPRSVGTGAAWLELIILLAVPVSKKGALYSRQTGCNQGPVDTAAPMSRKGAVYSRPAGTKGQWTKLTRLAEQLNIG